MRQFIMFQSKNGHFMSVGHAHTKNMIEITLHIKPPRIDFPMKHSIEKKHNIGIALSIKYSPILTTH